ncbi:hypothetical protein B0H14DRAFT_2643049 [Mycena olivaceomarginata]|nr:hypothetical protein B0H14DRAFT_2643049 [Mycena olivaceomarginata]
MGKETRTRTLCGPLLTPVNAITLLGEESSPGGTRDANRNFGDNILRSPLQQGYTSGGASGCGKGTHPVPTVMGMATHARKQTRRVARFFRGGGGIKVVVWELLRHLGLCLEQCSLGARHLWRLGAFKGKQPPTAELTLRWTVRDAVKAFKWNKMCLRFAPAHDEEDFSLKSNVNKQSLEKLKDSEEYIGQSNEFMNIREQTGPKDLLVYTTGGGKSSESTWKVELRRRRSATDDNANSSAIKPREDDEKKNVVPTKSARCVKRGAEEEYFMVIRSIEEDHCDKNTIDRYLLSRGESICKSAVDIIVDLRSATLGGLRGHRKFTGKFFAPCRMLVRFEAAESNRDAHTISSHPAPAEIRDLFASVNPGARRTQGVECNSRGAPDSLAEAEILFVFNSLNRNNLATCFNRLRCG